MYFLPLLDVVGNFPVIYVAIWLFRSRTLAKTELVWLGSGLIGYSSLSDWSCCLVDLRFLRFWCMVTWKWPEMWEDVFGWGHLLDWATWRGSLSWLLQVEFDSLGWRVWNGTTGTDPILFYLPLTCYLIGVYVTREVVSCYWFWPATSPLHLSCVLLVWLPWCPWLWMWMYIHHLIAGQ